MSDLRLPAARLVVIAAVAVLSASSATAATTPGPAAVRGSASASGSAAALRSPSASPTPSPRAGIGQFEPILDVAEPTITSGSAAMHERFGSASDGAVFIKDYGSAADGGTNVYHVTLYRTLDGVEWRSVSVPIPTDQQDSQAACRGWNCIVVSEFPQDGSVLVTDDGSHWDNVQPSPGLSQTTLTAGPNGFLMSGWNLTTTTPKVVFSTDGRSWRDVTFAGLPDFVAGSLLVDPKAGWLVLNGNPKAAAQPLIAVSADGQTWRGIEDPDGVYSTDHLNGQAIFHADGRWYLLPSYVQMPAGYSPGGLGRPASTSTPVATWSTVYWFDDGSSVLHSSGRLSTALPSEVVAMDGYLLGVRANPDFTASLLTASDPTAWTDAGLLPPGVPVPGSLHGLAVLYLPQLARTGPNVVMQGTALKPNEMGVGLYVAKALR